MRTSRSIVALALFPLALWITLLPNPALAGCLDYNNYLRWAGSYRGTATNVALAGSYAFIAASDYSNSQVQVLDVSTPALPRQIGSVQVPNADQHHIAFHPYEAYAYVAGSSLSALDISDPSHPEVVGNVPLSGTAAGIAASSQFLIVATFSRIQVYDIWSIPQTPQLLGSVDIGGAVTDIACQGGPVYATQTTPGNALKIVGIGDPWHPALLGSVGISGAAAVAVSGSYAYVASSGGATVVNVANPAAPYIVAGLAYSGGASAVAVSGARLAIGMSGAVALADVADPVHPHALGRIGAHFYCDDIALSGSYAYMACSTYGLLVVDATHGEAAPQAGGVAVPCLGSVAVLDTLACVTHGSSLTVFDIAQQLSPRVLGSTPLSMGASRVQMSVTHAYVSEYAYPSLGRFEVVDLAGPSVVGGVDLPDNALGVALAWPFAYVVCGSSLQIIDATDPSSPVVAGQAATPGEADGVFVSDDLEYAYVADFPGGLEVYDISNPTNPVRCGSLVLTGGGRDVVVDGTYAYLWNAWDGLHVIDVANPAHPVNLGRLYAGSVGYAGNWIGSLAATEGTVAIQARGIQLVDVTDPTHPRFGGTAYAANGFGIAVSGGFIYEGAADAFRVWCTQMVPGAVDWPEGPMPRGFDVEVCPNPAVRGTDIRFASPVAGPLRVLVLDASGRRVRCLNDGTLEAGEHRLFWDGRDASLRPAARGVYFIRLERGGQAESRRVVIVR